MADSEDGPNPAASTPVNLHHRLPELAEEAAPGRHPKFLQHIQALHHIGTLEAADGWAAGVGSCGDSVQVYLRVSDGTIKAIRCSHDGCQYTLACVSALGKLAQGRTITQALEIEPADVVAELGYLPEDHLHCARLAVNTLGEAVDNYFQKRW